jgi:signal peptidase I
MTNAENESNWAEMLRSLLLALLLALMFRSFLFEPFKVPTGSMKPTILVGDYLFVSKYKYGFSRYSFPFGMKIFSGRILEFSEPKRGDVIVFKLPKNPNINYIKRLIGFPGDKIQVKNGVLYINDVALKKTPAGYFEDSDGTKIPRFVETMPNNVSYYVLDERPDHILDNTQVFTVPKDHYFFMGDNRDNSIDSRVLSNVGFIPKENLIGNAKIIFFSSTAAWWEIWKWFSALRTDRFFNSLHPIKTS